MSDFEEVKKRIVEAFANIDVNVINSIVAPHGRKVFNSHEELMAVAIERAIIKMKKEMKKNGEF